MNDLLHEDAILAQLEPHTRDVAVEVVMETGSTNADLLVRVGQLSGPVLRAAERQTAGRGRAGRSWHSEPGASLTFSLAWPFATAQVLLGLSPAVGVAVAQALSTFGIEIQLKWPNDVQRDGQKLAGVLIETAHDKERKQLWAIIGIGLNLAASAELRQKLDRPIADLPELRNIGRNRLLAELLNRLATVLHRFAAEGFMPFVAQWNTRHAHADQIVRVMEGEQVLYQGKALGVDALGRLVLATEQGQVSVMAGDVSLRPDGER